MKRIIGTVLGIFLFFGVIFYFGGMQVINILLNSNLYYFFIALLIQFFIIFLYVVRLKTILSAQKYDVKYKKLFKILISGMAVNQLTPIVKAGGEPVKLYYLTKTNIPMTKATASVIIEITSELISFYSLLLILVIFLSATKLISIGFLYIGIVSFIICVGGFFFAFRILSDKNKIEKFIEKYLLRFFKPNAKISTKVFSSSFRYLCNKKLFLKIFSISFFCRFLEFLRIYFVFLAINFQVSFTIILAVWVLLILFSSIPWLPGGLGLVEGGTISSLLVLGIPSHISSSLILLDRFISFWIVVIIGLIVLYFLNKEIRQHTVW